MRIASSLVCAALSALAVSSCDAGGTRSAADADIGQPQRAETATTAATGVLTSYVGKYPFDAVDGVTFSNHPQVRAAVNAAVPDEDVRAWIFEQAGPQTPIVLRNGRLLSWGCQEHNCGDHNWTVSIAPSASAVEVCYYEIWMNTRARWYIGGGRTEMREGACPSE